MNTLGSFAFAILIALVTTLTGVNASAQQTAAAPTPAPQNPSWCADVPASTPPLNKISPEVWASVRQTCMKSKPRPPMEDTCIETCVAARELWTRASDPVFAAIPEKPPQNWAAGGKTQGQWTALREHCVALFSEIYSAVEVHNKPLPPFSPSDWQSCHEITGVPNQAPAYPFSSDKP